MPEAYVSISQHSVHTVFIPRRISRAIRAQADRKEDHQQLSICTNKTCKRQGSLQIAKFVEDLNLEGLTVQRTGCLAKCGAGPNIVVSPLNTTLSHINTVAKVKEVLQSVCGFDLSESLLKAVELRMAGNEAARSGRLQEAEALYSRALEQNVSSGRHLLLSNRSGVRLSLGKAAEAAQDAEQAAALSPPGFKNAFVRQMEAYEALGRHAAASHALASAASQDQAFAASPEYKEFHRRLEKKLAN